MTHSGRGLIVRTSLDSEQTFALFLCLFVLGFFFSFSKEHGRWLTVTDLFACNLTSVCAGRLNAEVNVEPVKTLDKEHHFTCY